MSSDFAGSLPSDLDLITNHAFHSPKSRLFQRQVNDLQTIGENPRKVASVHFCSSRWRCNDRTICAMCAAEHARKNARIVAADIALMKLAGYRPMWVILSSKSNGFSDLSATLDCFRPQVIKLRRSKTFANVIAGSGTIEIKRTDDGRALNVHWHGALAGALDPACDSTWRRINRRAGRYGSFVVNGRVQSRIRVARYGAKVDGYLPSAGSLDLWQYANHRRALRGRRLLLHWARWQQRNTDP